MCPKMKGKVSKKIKSKKKNKKKNDARETRGDIKPNRTIHPKQLNKKRLINLPKVKEQKAGGERRDR